MTAEKTHDEKPAAAAEPTPTPKEGGKEAKDWAEQLKKVAYAAAGAVNLSQDDVKSFVKRLVEKGEIARKDGEKILKQVAERVQQTVKRDAKAAADKATEAADAAAEKVNAAVHQEKLAEKINVWIERMLHTMNIATRKDVEDLSKQLDDLDKKVEQLIETAVASGRARKQPAPQIG